MRERRRPLRECIAPHFLFFSTFAQKPTGFVRRLSVAGTAVALGVVGYWLWETEVTQKQQAKQKQALAGRRA